MPEEKIPAIMREFVKTMEDGDVEKSLACFAEDAVWVNPAGTFRGKGEIRRYTAWMYDQIKDIKVKETGNGIIAQGNKAFFEHEITGTMEGKKATILAMCAYEFEGDKIKETRTIFDRLSMAQQAVKGGLPKMMVNMIVKQAEKGLR
ncbi:MAG TPA: nuclear transport factor 2 family protein [Dehalococcoidales bacterium]|nr:nuclear transport factor 2 family protein [Dehalococcoidales bacterium]